MVESTWPSPCKETSSACTVGCRCQTRVAKSSGMPSCPHDRVSRDSSARSRFVGNRPLVIFSTIILDFPIHVQQVRPLRKITEPIQLPQIPYVIHVRDAVANRVEVRLIALHCPFHCYMPESDPLTKECYDE